MVFQQLPVAAESQALGGPGGNTLTGLFGDLLRFFQRNALFLGRGQDADADGMGGILFTDGGHFQHLLGIHSFQGINLLQNKVALGDGTGFVHHHSLDIFHGFQRDTALEEDALFGTGADAGKEGQRHTEHQGTGTADDQEGQGGIDPVAPVAGEEGGQNGGGQSQSHHHRGIDPGKPGDEPVNFGLAGGGIFHRIQNTGNHRLFQHFFRPHFQQAGGIDAAGSHRAAFGHLHRHRLTGHRGGIDAAFALCDNAIQGNPVAGAYQQDVSHLSLGSRDGFGSAFTQHPLHHFGPQVHRLHDLAAALFHSPVLEVFTGPVEQHDAHRFGEVVNAQRAQGGNAHQEVFIKHMAPGQVFQSGEQHFAAQYHIGNQENAP